MENLVAGNLDTHRWKDGKMVMRWAASALLAAEKKFRRIQGYRDLWMLKAKLEDHLSAEEIREAA